MNTPRLWRIPENYPNRLIGMYDYDNSPDRCLFTQGKLISQRTDVPTFIFDAPKSRLIKFDVLPNETKVPLISLRAASLLEEICPKDFQLIPAKIRAHDTSLDEYFLLNVVAAISGMDHVKSSFRMIPGTQHINKVERLRYADGAMGSHHLAREREYLPFLWISKDLIQKLAQEKIKACEFEAPEDIHP